MNLPPQGCVNCAPDGLWRCTPAGLRRCTCERGRALQALDQARRQPALSRVEPRITIEAADSGVSILSALRYFPSEEGARIAIGNELRSMCNTGDEMLWLCARMVRLFTDWPGVPSLRAVFCAKFFPLDRDSRAICPDFPDGVPAQIEQAEPPRLALPPGHVASADQLLESGIRMLAEYTNINRPPVVPLRPIPRVPDVPVNLNFKPITQADIERALEELRDDETA